VIFAAIYIHVPSFLHFKGREKNCTAAAVRHGKLTDIALLEDLLEVSVVTVLLNGVRSDDAHEVVVVQELPHRQVAESYAAAA